MHMRDNFGKKCSKCGETKKLTEFYRNSTSRDGFRADCKSCHSIRYREWRQANQERLREKMRQYRIENADALVHAKLMRTYGISLERYVEMFEAQGGVCAICRGTYARALAVDHDHACCPGKKSCGECVRGLLCGSCNVGLGNFREDPSRMYAAISYLEKE